MSDEKAWATSWFGEDWGAPVCKGAVHDPIPIGRACMFCTEPFNEASRGLTWPCVFGAPDPEPVSTHVSCFMHACGFSEVGEVQHCGIVRELEKPL